MDVRPAPAAELSVAAAEEDLGWTRPHDHQADGAVQAIRMADGSDDTPLATWLAGASAGAAPLTRGSYPAPMTRRPREKQYAKSAEDFQPLVFGRGACIASIRITVDGRRVGYCYREKPNTDIDSGWRFFAGDENDAFSRKHTNFEMYDCNTIANYDPEIVPLLGAPPGSAFVRDAKTGAFVAESGPA